VLDFFVVFFWLSAGEHHLEQRYGGLVYDCETRVQEIAETYSSKYEIKAILCQRTEVWAANHRNAPWRKTTRRWSSYDKRK